MTNPSRKYNLNGIDYNVRNTLNGSRIVNSSDGWVIRVDHPEQKEKSQKRIDRWTILTARMIYDCRSRGETLPVPWGRVIKYGRKRREIIGGNKKTS